VVRRAIYVAMISQQNQQLVPLISGAVLPGGGENLSLATPDQDREGARRKLMLTNRR
jgi:hypothetical protein